MMTRPVRAAMVARRRPRRRSHSVPAFDRAGLQLTAAAIHADKGRSRTLVLIVMAAALVLLYFMLRYPRNGRERMQADGTSASLSASGNASGKNYQCYTDTDCPAMTFCNSNHLCEVRAALAPPLVPTVELVRSGASGASVGAALGRAVDRVLGRGRGGEGAETVRTSDERKGEKP
jgi:hypothetical protein